MVIRIKHPNFEPGRVKAIGVEFVDGFAEVESLAPETRDALKQHGFTFEEVEQAAPAEPKPLSKFTKKELIQYAVENNIEIDEKAKAADILVVIEAVQTLQDAPAAQEETPDDEDSDTDASGDSGTTKPVEE
ncbi:MAG: hypothetical protein WBA28_00485 [Microbacteriaceae bacterium]